MEQLTMDVHEAYLNDFNEIYNEFMPYIIAFNKNVIIMYLLVQHNWKISLLLTFENYFVDKVFIFPNKFENPMSLLRY